MQLNEDNERFSSSTVSTFKSTSSFNFQVQLSSQVNFSTSSSTFNKVSRLIN